MLMSIIPIVLVAAIRFRIALRQWCPLFWSSITSLGAILLHYRTTYDLVDSVLGNRNIAHLLGVLLTCSTLYLLQDAWSRGFTKDTHLAIRKTARNIFLGAALLMVVTFCNGSYLGSSMRLEAAYVDDPIYVTFRITSLVYCAFAAMASSILAAQISTRASPDERFAIKFASAAMGLAALSYSLSAFVQYSPFLGFNLYANSDLLIWNNSATRAALIVTGFVFSAPALFSLHSSLKTEFEAIKLHRRTKRLWLHATSAGAGVPVLEGHHRSARASMHRMIIEIWDAHSSSPEPELILTGDDVEFITHAEEALRAS